MKKWMLVAAGVGLAAAIGVALAGVPSDAFTVDFRTKEKQFDIRTRRLNTPEWIFTMQQGGTAWTGTGYTVTLKYSKTSASDAMATATGTVSGSTVTFSITSNYLANTISDGYAMLLVTSNATMVSYAEGTITILPAPEISAEGILTRTKGVYGTDYGPFTGSFAGWPFLESGAAAGTGCFVNVSNRVVALESGTSRWDTAYGAATGGLVNVSNRVVTVESGTSRWDLAYGWGDHSTAGYATTTIVINVSNALVSALASEASQRTSGDSSSTNYANGLAVGLTNAYAAADIVVANLLTNYSQALAILGSNYTDACVAQRVPTNDPVYLAALTNVVRIGSGLYLLPTDKPDTHRISQKGLSASGAATLSEIENGILISATRIFEDLLAYTNVAAVYPYQLLVSGFTAGFEPLNGTYQFVATEHHAHPKWQQEEADPTLYWDTTLGNCYGLAIAGYDFEFTATNLLTVDDPRGTYIDVTGSGQTGTVSAIPGGVWYIRVPSTTGLEIASHADVTYLKKSGGTADPGAPFDWAGGTHSNMYSLGVTNSFTVSAQGSNRLVVGRDSVIITNMPNTAAHGLAMFDTAGTMNLGVTGTGNLYIPGVLGDSGGNWYVGQVGLVMNSVDASIGNIWSPGDLFLYATRNMVYGKSSIGGYPATNHVFYIGGQLTMQISSNSLMLPTIKRGADQATAGAITNEMWFDTDDLVFRLGL